MSDRAESPRRAERLVQGLVFAALFLAGAVFDHPVDYDNTSSRYFLLSAMVDEGTLAIDTFQSRTIDKSSHGGHYYSSKAPGASLLGVGVYWVMRQLTDGPPLSLPARYVVRVATSTLLFGVLGVVMYRMARRTGAAASKSLLIVMSLAFGTILFVHSTLFSGHMITASFGFFAFALVFRAPGEEAGSSGWETARFMAAGFLAGFAALTDFHAVIVVFFLSWYVLWRRARLANGLAFFGGILICVSFLAFYNAACFGDPLALSYSQLALPQFNAESRVGVLGVTWPDARVLGILLVSPSRGLFMVMPVLLLSIPGIGMMLAHREWRREGLLVIGIVTAYVLFNAGLQGWHGGWTFGPRHLLPIIPFMVFAMAFGAWDGRVFLGLFMVSCFQVLAAVAVMPHTPEGIANPLMEIIFPCMGYGYMARNVGVWMGLPAWPALAAMAVGVAALCVTAYRQACRVDGECVAGEGASRVLRVAAGIWLLAVVGSLAWVKTSPARAVHEARGRVLGHAAQILRSADLTEAAQRESLRATMEER